jgi:hypothetical protein
MTSKKVIVFILLFSIFFSPNAYKVSEAFDCLTLTTSSSDSDKNYCRSELNTIEAELANLINKQKEQQKQSR